MTDVAKYPRTCHLTFSEGCTNDDKMLKDNDHLIGQDIVITAKLDGSNFCMTNQQCFARSHNGPPTHQSFDWAKMFHGQIRLSVPDNIVVYAEYLFAKHSIHYTNLPHYLFVFNVIDLDNNRWLSWDDIEVLSQKLSIPTAPVLYRGTVDSRDELQKLCLSLMKEKEFQVNEREGIVIRLADSFQDFDLSIAKMVRKNHVQTDVHWKHQQIVKNLLCKDKP